MSLVCSWYSLRVEGLTAWRFGSSLDIYILIIYIYIYIDLYLPVYLSIYLSACVHIHIIQVYINI